MSNLYIRSLLSPNSDATSDDGPADAAMALLRQIRPSAPATRTRDALSRETILAAYERAPATAPRVTTAPPAQVAPQHAARNNNPVNLRGGGWDGDLGKAEGGFSRFATPQDGLRAAAKQLQKDGNRLKTIEQVVRKLSPPNENNSGQMPKDIAGMAGFGPREPLDFNDPVVLEKILRAYARREDAAFADSMPSDDFSEAVTKALNGSPGSQPAAYGKPGNFGSSRAPALPPPQQKPPRSEDEDPPVPAAPIG